MTSILHLLQNLNCIFDSLQAFVPADDFHALEQRRADFLPRCGYAQDAEDLIGIQSALFDVCPQRRLAAFVTDSWLLDEDLVRPLSDLRRLLSHPILWRSNLRDGSHIFLEEETTKRNAVVQRDQSLADERDNFQQDLIVHVQSLTGEIRLDTGSQVFGGKEADVRRIEMIQFLKLMAAGEGVTN